MGSVWTTTSHGGLHFVDALFTARRFLSRQKRRQLHHLGTSRRRELEVFSRLRRFVLH